MIAGSVKGLVEVSDHEFKISLGHMDVFFSRLFSYADVGLERAELALTSISVSPGKYDEASKGKGLIVMLGHGI